MAVRDRAGILILRRSDHFPDEEGTEMCEPNYRCRPHLGVAITSPMKRGLKCVNNFLASIDCSCSDHFPDEEGTEMKHYCPFHFASHRSDHFPDEEGTEMQIRREDLESLCS